MGLMYMLGMEGKQISQESIVWYYSKLFRNFLISLIKGTCSLKYGDDRH